MASRVFSSSVLKKKFRGCMIGALVGDCLGFPFEIECFLLPSNQKLVGFLNGLTSGESKETLFHTDDTRMILNIASSIVEKGDINLKDIAEKFSDDYFNQTIDRGYGTHVRKVFHKLKESNYNDVFKPAKEQFNGSGSFGNGGAMRMAPIALFGNRRGEEYVLNAAKENALITHAHRDGYRGAMLQCLAVNATLELDPSQELDPVKFTDCLIEKMKKIETEEIKPYCESLKKMKEIFVQKREDISSEEIAKCLGNEYACLRKAELSKRNYPETPGDDVSALKSVTPAIYSFLRGMKPMKNYESDNPFMRTIYFSVSIGGDTDTIASMAGAIAGAYYGEDMIPDVVQKRCEGIDEIISLADKLFDVTYKEK